MGYTHPDSNSVWPATLAAAQAHSYDPGHQKAAAQKTKQVVLAREPAVLDLLGRRTGRRRRWFEAGSEVVGEGAMFEDRCCRF